MGIIEVKKVFTRRELLWFGPLLAVFAGIIGAIAIFWHQAPRVAYGIWISAAVVTTLVDPTGVLTVRAVSTPFTLMVATCSAERVFASAITAIDFNMPSLGIGCGVTEPTLPALMLQS